MHRTRLKHNPDPKASGEWRQVEARFSNAATHVALLPTNKIFTYGGSSLDPEEFTNPALPCGEILDLETMEVRPLNRDALRGDLWCGGHTLLADGKLLFAGGTNYYPASPEPLYGGLRQAYLFDPFTESWERLPDMQEGRWYPTLIRLADDTVLAISGLKYRDPQEPAPGNIFTALFQLLTQLRKRIADVQEVYDPVQERWRPMESSRFFPLYPRLHLLPDGDVFYSGVFNTHFFMPGRYPSARWDHRRDAWQEVGGPHSEVSREEGISLLLPLRPPGYMPRVMVAGGGTHNLGRMLMSLLHNTGKESWSRHFRFLTEVQASVEVINLGEPQPRWRDAGRMHHRRIHANGVLLPDGNVLVVGGMSGYGAGHAEHGVLSAEMYDPESNRWTEMARQKRPRLYHSTALLLPDGRVISMGSNPRAKVIEKSAEIYSPPYLFRGDRPVITRCPEQLAYRNAFRIGADAPRQVSQVVLMRPEVLTHVTNTDQRLLELPFRVVSTDRLEVEGPRNPAHMPRGYCLLFLLDRDGVPSEGKFVRLGGD